MKLRKILKVVAIVAAVVAVVSFVFPGFGAMVMNALSNIGSAIAETASQLFAGGEAAAAAAEAATLNAAASEAAAAGIGALDAAAVADVGASAAATQGATQIASQAAVPAAEAQVAANVAAQPGFPGVDAFGEGLVAPQTPTVAPQTPLVAPETPLVGPPEAPPPGKGLLSSVWEGAKAAGDWAQKNPLLASTGLKVAAVMLQEDPYRAQTRAQMELDEWARRRLNDSIMGAPSPFSASGPQQRLRYVSGSYVFPNTPRGIIGRNLAR